MGNWLDTRSKLGNALQKDPHADVVELRRQFKADMLEKWIRERVDAAPALSPEQRAHLARLLDPSGGDSP